jgi:hypothetical protein
MPAPVLPTVRRTLRAVAATVVPDAAALDEPGWNELEAIVEQALAIRPPAVRRQLGVFLRLIEFLPTARFGRRFSRLDAAARTRVLAWLQDSPLLLVRRGFWGVRTLVLMGYYARPAAARAIGYRAEARGWGARA